MQLSTEKFIIQMHFFLMGLIFILPPPYFLKEQPCVVNKNKVLILHVLIIGSIALLLKPFHLEYTNLKSLTGTRWMEFIISRLVWLNIIIKSYKFRSEWKELLDSLLKLDNCHGISKTILILIFPLSIFNNTINVIISHAYGHNGGIDVEILAFIRNLICFKISLIAYLFKRKFTLLNYNFKTILQEPSEKATNIIISVKKSYIELDGLIEKFNRLNGYQLVLIVSHSSLQLINAAMYGLWKSTKLHGSLDIVISTVLLPYVSSAINLFHMMDSCHSIKVAIGKLLRTTYKMEKSFSIFSEQFLELRNLSRMVYYQRTAITAHGYFEINRLTIFYFLYNTSTYFVVLVQYYRK